MFESFESIGLHEHFGLHKQWIGVKKPRSSISRTTRYFNQKQNFRNFLRNFHFQISFFDYLISFFLVLIYWCRDFSPKILLRITKKVSKFDFSQFPNWLFPLKIRLFLSMFQNFCVDNNFLWWLLFQKISLRIFSV